MPCFTLQLDNDGRAFFTALYEQYQIKMFRVAMTVCGNQWIAEDAVQDAFCKAAQNFDYIRTLSDRHLGAWLLVVCKNSAIDILRKESRYVGQPEHIENIDFETPETQFEYSQLVSAIRSLPNEQRRLLELKYIEGRSHQDIADLLGISNNAVRIRIHRSKKSLADIIEKGESYEH